MNVDVTRDWSLFAILDVGVYLTVNVFLTCRRRTFIVIHHSHQVFDLVTALICEVAFSVLTKADATCNRILPCLMVIHHRSRPSNCQLVLQTESTLRLVTG